jgi:hypothetical protein
MLRQYVNEAYFAGSFSLVGILSCWAAYPIIWCPFGYRSNGWRNHEGGLLKASGPGIETTGEKRSCRTALRPAPGIAKFEIS